MLTAGVRLQAALDVLACIRQFRHQVELENSWCRSCNTGICPDCGHETMYVVRRGDYRHIDPDRECFLIQDNRL